MKKQIAEKSEQQLKREYPIEGGTPGWFYSVNEISNGYWRITGSDKWGRKISIDGTDPDQLLDEAETEAAKIDE